MASGLYKPLTKLYQGTLDFFEYDDLKEKFTDYLDSLPEDKFIQEVHLLTDALISIHNQPTYKDIKLNNSMYYFSDRVLSVLDDIERIMGYNFYMKRTVFEYDMHIIFTKILYFSDSLIPDTLSRKYPIYSVSYLEQAEHTHSFELLHIFKGISTKGITQIIVYMSLITKQELGIHGVSFLTKTQLNFYNKLYQVAQTIISDRS